MTQASVARRSGTSRPTLSAYERGRVSPSLATAERILAETGHRLTIMPIITFHEHQLRYGPPILVPSSLPRLPLTEAFATVVLPLRLNWSSAGRRFDMSNRRERARVYEAVITQGGPDEILTYIDGALLVDGWNDLVLPRQVRSVWQPVIDQCGGLNRRLVA